ncbi:MAG: hypothetical protein K0S12_1190 [Bacteroidetes bacterium]|jgi:hypothetical protein|nr:hypothetical protein [Bacteroidota bacterium]
MKANSLLKALCLNMTLFIKSDEIKIAMLITMKNGNAEN